MKVNFPEPDVEHRLLLWGSSFSRGVPLAPDVDLEFCAQRFKLSGGHIRNISVTSAYLAAEDGSPVTMQHVIWGIQREYRKLGRLCRDDEFGPYFPLLSTPSRSPV